MNENYTVNIDGNEIVSKFGDNDIVCIKNFLIGGKKIFSNIHDVAISFKGTGKLMFMYLLDNGDYYMEDKLDFANEEDAHVNITYLKYVNG